MKVGTKKIGLTKLPSKKFPTKNLQYCVTADFGFKAWSFEDGVSDIRMCEEMDWDMVINGEIYNGWK